jgi:hypothetical protein
MSAGQAEVLSTQAWRTAREVVMADGDPAPDDDIVVHTDPAGAANLMREVVALGAFSVALEEHDGHWHVAVRGGPHPEAVLARIVDLAASCVERGIMTHATLCIGKRRYTIEPAPETGFPACAA